MRTLRSRIILVLTLGFIASFLTLSAISASIARRTTVGFFEGSMKLQLRQAQRIYETGGTQHLAEYLAETDAALKGTRYLTDAGGRDLVSGEDRSKLLSTGFDPLGFPKTVNGRLVVSRESADGRYRLVVVAPPPLGFGPFIPYFLAAAIAIGLLGWILSAGIVSPLQRVADSVNRFGRGDLSARVASDRKDEIGNLARSFNAMAGRIQTLLTAERRLLQDVSHELRSPLARLSFAAELMKDTADPEAALGRIRREIHRLSELVAALLEVNSADWDPASIRTQFVPVPSLIQEIVTDCGFGAVVRNIRIETEMQSVTIEGDRELLRRAIENVLRNAIRFAPAGSSILVQVEQHESKALIRIRDYGPGVPEDMILRIFDPFFRVDESRDAAAGGVGLGLSIARRAVLMHRGEIEAENVSPGLQVTIAIPVSAS